MIAADVVEETFGVGFLLSAFFFGFRHGIDWDHIAAITDITSSQENKRDAMFFGTVYALGHAMVVFIVGLGAVLLGQRLPDSIDGAMERVVGATLILLAVYVFVALIRHGREFRLRSRWMLIFAGVRKLYRRIRSSRDLGHEDEPVHIHEGDEASVAIPVGGDISVADWHHGHHGRPGHHHHSHPEPDEAFMNYGRGTAFVVGMIHGVGAETPTQLVLFLTVAGVGGKGAGILGLGAFILGLLGSNSLITFGSSVGFLKASENWGVYVTIAVLTAVFSLIVGVLFMFGAGSVLPAVFGG